MMLPLAQGAKQRSFRGAFSLSSSTGNSNVAVGSNALHNSTTRVRVILHLGASAGIAVTGGGLNIDIGNNGTSDDSNVIRIGTTPYQTSTYIAGITGVPVTGAAVIVNSSGQLGVRASSIKYKEDVHDIADDDSALMRLRPVAFRYKGTRPVQFGLIAEEVEKVFPELVVKDSNGQPMSVQYHELPALLLKQLQTQRNQIDSQNRTIELLEKRLTDLEAKLK